MKDKCRRIDEPIKRTMGQKRLLKEMRKGVWKEGGEWREIENVEEEENRDGNIDFMFCWLCKYIYFCKGSYAKES